MESGQTRRIKHLEWIASSLDDLKEFPDVVQDNAGHDLWIVQQGRMPSTAKVLKGFGGAGVMELVERYDSDTYRVVYTAQFKQTVYVLHAFQKKAKQGIKTPKKEMDVVKSRLRMAIEEYARRYPNEA